MNNKILLTGQPRSGKSTLLQKIVSDIPDKVGFVTKEMKDEQGNRVGFEMVTNTGYTSILAHVDFNTPEQVSRYKVDVAHLDDVVTRITTFGRHDLLYIDEIGQMELFSDTFKKLVLAYLDAPNQCLMTVSQVYQSDFIDRIKRRSDITLIELTQENRGEIEGLIKNRRYTLE